jgi:alpha-tubulin suppressor-like RCC1 family protein
MLGQHIVDVACGSTHTLLLSSQGQVFAFGMNYAGQLGNGTSTNREQSTTKPKLSMELNPLLYSLVYGI